MMHIPSKLSHDFVRVLKEESKPLKTCDIFPIFLDLLRTELEWKCILVDTNWDFSI